MQALTLLKALHLNLLREQERERPAKSATRVGNLVAQLPSRRRARSELRFLAVKAAGQGEVGRNLAHVQPRGLVVLREGAKCLLVL